MRSTPTPGSVSGRRVDRAGDPLDGLINLFDLSLVLAVGLLLAALSSIGATSLIVPSGSNGQPLKGQPPTSGQSAQGQGQEVGKVYRLSDGRYVFAPSGSTTGGSTGTTGSTGATPGTTGSTGATSGATSSSGSTTTPPSTGSTGATSSIPAPTATPGLTTN